MRQPRRPAPKWAAPIPDQPLPGIVDPAKVVRVALQDAASIAGLLITREAMVAEAPKRDRRRTGYDHPSTDAFAAAAPHILAA
jgi:hypothetical protein